MFKICNLCGFPIVRINKSAFGTRCINCRSTYAHRAIGYYIQGLKLDEYIRVHEFSNHGAFLKYLRKNFKNLTTSEFYEDVRSGDYHNGIQCQDLQSLSFDDNSFDLLTSTEVFEHVPNDTRGFQEVLRCLKSGGSFVFTVPLDLNKKETVVRAHLKGGKVHHILKPEYHGDHLRAKGILSFRTYGLDIEDKLLEIGFSKVTLNKIFLKNLAMDRPIPVVHATK